MIKLATVNLNNKNTMTMKKIIIASALAGLTTFTYGQKLEITNAAVAYKPLNNPMWMMMDKDGSLKKKLYEAKTEIDKAYVKYEAANTLKPKDEAKLFYYRGIIYLDYLMSADSSMLPELEKNEAMYDEASLGSLKKSLKLDTRGMYKKQIETKIQLLRGTYLQGGVALFQQEKYKDALEAFSGAAEMYDVIGLKDSLALYNAALSADRLEDYDNAIKYFKACAEIGYKTEVSYQSLIANVNKKNGGPSDEAYKYIVEGKKTNPGSMALLIEEFNYHLSKGDTEKAQSSLEEAIKKDPDNYVFHFNIGATFDELAAKKHKEGKHDEADVFAQKAIEGYKKAIELKPDFADAYFNLGVLFNNESFELNSLVNEIKDEVLYKKEKEKATGYLKEAYPYLEESNKLQPKDVNTLKLLKNIYFNLEMDDEYAVVKAKLEALGQ